MRTDGFREEQTIRIISQMEVGVPVPDRRQHQITPRPLTLPIPSSVTYLCLL